MIKINLAPLEELENKLWYIPDLFIILAISLSSWFGVQYYLGQIKEDIVKITEERQNYEKSYQRLKPDLERFSLLNREVDQLKKKLNSLRQITVSKISRYRPIILLEHLQNLKPDGLWFNFLKDDSDEQIIRLVGGAFDNLLIAEFMSALTRTKFLEVDATDLRTQVYFPRVYLERVATTGSKSSQKKGNYSAESAAFAKIQDQQIRQSAAGSYWKSHEKDFPEMAKFPGFEMNIRYAERSANDQNLER
ncbi:MAG: PilN domain-containing protein [Deltaproteobacteria bacterium]|nr:PilN domain-containing protein [Deltaproteobacteria bacterium]